MTPNVAAMHSIIRIPDDAGMKKLRNMFPTAQADDMNFVMFSTSGVHGTYTTLEEIEEEFTGSDHEFCRLTILIVQPRVVCLHYGTILIEREDIPFLKTLRATSAKVMAEWNMP